MNTYNKKDSLAETAYKELKNRILVLELRPGQILIEEDLSKELGVSRTPIRAALQRLHYEDLVVISKNKSTKVTKLSINYFLDVFELREVLNVVTAKKAAINHTDEELKLMQECLDNQKHFSLSNNFNVSDFLHYDRIFHELIALMSKNKVILGQEKHLYDLYSRYIYFATFASRAYTVYKEHERIYDFIKVHNSVDIQPYMKEHINDVRNAILPYLIKPENEEEFIIDK